MFSSATPQPYQKYRGGKSLNNLYILYTYTFPSVDRKPFRTHNPTHKFLELLNGIPEIICRRYIMDLIRQDLLCTYIVDQCAPPITASSKWNVIYTVKNCCLSRIAQVLFRAFREFLMLLTSDQDNIPRQRSVRRLGRKVFLMTITYYHYQNQNQNQKSRRLGYTARDLSPQKLSSVKHACFF